MSSKKPKVDESKLLPLPLRSIYSKTTFGLQTIEGDLSAIHKTSNDEEIIAVVGNRITLIHCNEPHNAEHIIRTFYPHHSGVNSIKFVVQSPTFQYIGASATLEKDSDKVHALVYDKNPESVFYSKPAMVSYQPGN